MAPPNLAGQSEWRAEQALKTVAERSDMELVVLRPPLVYGPAAPRRLAMLLLLLRSGQPVPAAGLPARRSVVFIDNLLDAIESALEYTATAGRCLAPGAA